MSAQTSAPPGAQWFALHTLSGQEAKVKSYIEKFKKAEELDEFIFEVLLPTEIDEIYARIEAANGKEVPKVQYSVGEEVKITDGAFASLTGRIDEIDPDRGKLKVSVSIFGRFTPVELEYWQVQRATE